MLSLKRYGKYFPRALKSEDSVFLFAPSGAIRSPFREEGITWLKSLGYDVILGQSLAAAANPFAAGSKEKRLADWQKALDQKTPAILPARGGYGGIHLLPDLPLQAMQTQAPIWIGSSDATVMQSILLQKSNLVSFYGPMPCGQLAEPDPIGRASYQATLVGQMPEKPNLAGAFSLVGGSAIGELRGGCLSILASLCGTPDQLDGQDAILILEDIAEHPFRLERMLYQLYHAGCLRGCRGIILGTFPKCADASGNTALVWQMFRAFFANFNIPVLANAPVGHGLGSICLPIGVLAQLTDQTLTILESPFAK